MPSACIFGSTARNRFDHLSDKDVLVVACSEREATEASRDWFGSGWSVTKCTHQQMQNMAHRGSLFLQHLKQEGIIVKDDDGFLSSIIHRFRPKHEYESELRDSFSLLSNLSRKPLTYWPMLCSADMAYVAIRNIAISRLAERGIYTFDYADLIDHFTRKCRIALERSESLIQLRVLMHGYRNRRTGLSPWQALKDALAGAEELFGQRCGESSQAKGNQFGYWGLRSLELELVKMTDPRQLDILPTYDPLGRAWALIRDPRDYPSPHYAAQVGGCGLNH
jgi:hypothetical protein